MRVDDVEHILACVFSEGVGLKISVRFSVVAWLLRQVRVQHVQARLRHGAIEASGGFLCQRLGIGAVSVVDQRVSVDGLGHLEGFDGLGVLLALYREGDLCGDETHVIARRIVGREHRIVSNVGLGAIAIERYLFEGLVANDTFGKIHARDRDRHVRRIVERDGVAHCVTRSSEFIAAGGAIGVEQRSMAIDGDLRANPLLCESVGLQVIVGSGGRERDA